MLRRILGRRALGAPPAAAASWPDVSTSDADRAIIERALPFTMTGPARLQALVDAVRYVVARGIGGDLAECGVWRGGSVLAMVLTLQDLGAPPRDLHLYDTFEGMTAPTELDTSKVERPALETWNEARADGTRAWPEMFGPEVFDEQ